MDPWLMKHLGAEQERVVSLLISVPDAIGQQVRVLHLHQLVAVQDANASCVFMLLIRKAETGKMRCDRGPLAQSLRLL